MSRKPLLKNLDFSKIWDPGIWQSARERPFGYYADAVKSSIPGDLIFNLKKRARDWRPSLWEDSLGGNARSRTRKSRRVQKRLQLWRPPLAKGHLGGILPGIFEKYFLLARRDPAKSIFETILSRKRFCKNLDFKKKMGFGDMAECQRGCKVAPLGYCSYAGALLPEGVQRGS